VNKSFLFFLKINEKTNVIIVNIEPKIILSISRVSVNNIAIINKNIRIFVDNPSLYKTSIKEQYTSAVPVSF